ncbi:ribosome small subunit-dependent GTPase A [Lyngbya confervoides]|uniref:Small ribosomal subunit biogenesis GTPase RsgA n=1 Tax=Lyngbya confervoides BDU141951 TaxID=1574623 RepID=A0ABD4SYB9_9CYAN|nr:ribosome small subunit-dependent GTPase A [Lyngbya confervoides]MCM1981451.1 ribosome small subunit-dependent GTPase A [Lyngbya confervoides BDU141951]
MQLKHLGWNDRLAQHFAPYAQQGYGVGRVAIAHRDQYHLYTDQGHCTAVVSGKFRHQAHSIQDFPVVGDWVVMETQTHPAVIHGVLPRTSQFTRRAAGTRTQAQIIAANLDTIFLVSGLDHDFNLRRIERYLVMTWESGANPVIVLNKADLCEDIEDQLSAVANIAISVPILALSALTRDKIADLDPYLQPGQTVALLGSSGVGKSTLTNQLLGKAVQATQAVRVDDSRGRHTTTHREMLQLPSGALLIDTPGMRELQLWTAEESLQETFSDLEALAQSCRFRNCQHQSEPGCAVQEAIAEGRVPMQRLQSYRKLQREQAHVQRQQDPLAQRNRKKRWKAITKSMRQNRQG